MAGGGAACGSVDFHMVELARRTCPTEGGLPLKTGKQLIEDGFLRLRLAAAARRSMPGAPALDIGASFRG
eukprot:5325083-Pleurochrysis_carterae.AAC.1